MIGLPTDQNETREYIVTVKKGVDWKEVHNELIRDTSSDDLVDSNIVPDRECECTDERTINNRNTHYNLSEAEAIKLRQDSRVVAVTAIDFKPTLIKKAVQVANFNKYGYHAESNDCNWGLLRHTKESNPYTSQADPGLTYDYVLDGTGVDVVIMDSGIEANHPEWQDANGVSRLKQIDWFTASGLAGTMPSNFYTDNDGHGTHVTGLVAGKTFGFAKNADIYVISLDPLTGGITNGISFQQACDVLKGWHLNKGTGRPTVVNMSFGNGVKIFAEDPVKLETSVGNLSVTGGRYRGVSHTDTAYNDFQDKGLTGSGQFTTRSIGVKDESDDANIEQLIDVGINVCIASGNEFSKNDMPGGVDYNNYFTFEFGGGTYYWYYNRGSSPSTIEPGKGYLRDALNDKTISDLDKNAGFMVGNIAKESDKKLNSSNTGPGVNIYVAGDQVNSAVSNTRSPGYTTRSYQNDSGFREAKASGTSMSSPNMAGLCALLLQVHPDWTPTQVMKYFESNAQLTLKNQGTTQDYTNYESLLGGEPRIAYLPMNGKKPFGYSSS